jgi:hypothetical protein
MTTNTDRIFRSWSQWTSGAGEFSIARRWPERCPAKLELKERLGRSKAHSERTIDIETTDKLTDPQIVAKVNEHTADVASIVRVRGDDQRWIGFK